MPTGVYPTFLMIRFEECHDVGADVRNYRGLLGVDVVTVHACFEKTHKGKSLAHGCNYASWLQVCPVSTFATNSLRSLHQSA